MARSVGGASRRRCLESARRYRPDYHTVRAYADASSGLARARMIRGRYTASRDDGAAIAGAGPAMRPEIMKSGALISACFFMIIYTKMTARLFHIRR